MLSRICDPGAHTVSSSVGLLLLRLGAGGMMAIGHGWGKVQNFASYSEKFMDFAGLGPKVSLSLCIGGELVCGLMIALGLFTRLASVPFAITMAVAAFVAHANDPLFLGPGVTKAMEPALLYLIPAVALLLTGAGTFSVDAMILGGKAAKKPSA